ncbi:MAG: hypothetical protein GY855_17725 [candidate division Zixibacteria bacterium]|nr:hypothetical protein [candidate division Zixibacteria bacterium]
MNRIILFYVGVFVLIASPLKITANNHHGFALLNGSIKSVWDNNNEKARDFTDIRIPAPIFKYDYFRFPQKGFVVDTVYQNPETIQSITAIAIDNLKPNIIPNFMQNEVMIFDFKSHENKSGYYLAYYLDDSLVVFSGDDTQYHFTVESSYTNRQELITQANRYFHLPSLTPDMFSEDDWYGLKVEFEIDGKRAELRGYDRKYKLVDIDPNKEPPPPEKLERKIQVIELVVYNE